MPKYFLEWSPVIMLLLNFKLTRIPILNHITETAQIIKELNKYHSFNKLLISLD